MFSFAGRRTLIGIEQRQLPGEAAEYVLLMLDPGLPVAELQDALRYGAAGHTSRCGFTKSAVL